MTPLDLATWAETAVGGSMILALPVALLAGLVSFFSPCDHSPDLMFLDVQMPQMNGFDVIDAVGPERMPLVIFVTAYDQHALKAFQVRALDYILTPFDRERFSEALQRARKQV